MCWHVLLCIYGHAVLSRPDTGLELAFRISKTFYFLERRETKYAYFIIDDGQLYRNNDEDGRLKVTHVRRLDGGGVEYLKIWVSDGNVLGGRTVGEAMFTLTVTPDGRLEGMVPGGYQYDFVAEEKE